MDYVASYSQCLGLTAVFTIRRDSQIVLLTYNSRLKYIVFIYLLIYNQSQLIYLLLMLVTIVTHIYRWLISRFALYLQRFPFVILNCSAFQDTHTVFFLLRLWSETLMIQYSLKQFNNQCYNNKIFRWKGSRNKMF